MFLCVVVTNLFGELLMHPGLNNGRCRALVAFRLFSAFGDGCDAKLIVFLVFAQGMVAANVGIVSPSSHHVTSTMSLFETTRRTFGENVMFLDRLVKFCVGKKNHSWNRDGVHDASAFANERNNTDW